MAKLSPGSDQEIDPASSPFGVIGRCEQCGEGHEVVGMDLLDDGVDVTCRCGGPVYALDAVIELDRLADDDPLAVEQDPFTCPGCVAVGEVCSWHRGWAAGWDACCRVVQATQQGRPAGPVTMFDQDAEDAAGDGEVAA